MATFLARSVLRPASGTRRAFNSSAVRKSWSPWSSNFKGGKGTAIALQSLVYGLGIGLVVAKVQTPSSSSTNAKETQAKATNASDTINPVVASLASQPRVNEAISRLKQTFPETGYIITDTAALHVYGSSENSYHGAAPHSVIVRPLSTEDVVKVVNISREYRVPITAYSGATSLEGHYAGTEGGSICLDMSRMNKVLQINEDDGDLICQSGARWEDVNELLREKGIPLFFPLDPGPGATIGGMIGTGCSGTNAVKYGTARDQLFLNVTAVLPNGQVIKTRSRARKSAAGFDTTKLFIGAEGTLGIVTEATLKLSPVIPYKVAIAQFPNVEKAVSAVQALLKSEYGSQMQCIELVDDNMMRSINIAGLVENPYPISDTLFLKIQGTQESLKTASPAIQSICSRHGSTAFDFAETDEKAEELWMNRKYALMSTMAAEPGHRCWTTDVCVPVSNLPRLVYETKDDLAKSGLKSTIVGHVGDGNFHALILFKDGDQEELGRVGDAVHRMVNRAIGMDGTCTGEHGVGLGKKMFLRRELGDGTIELMKEIKKTIDPLNLFNPGKLYPDEKSEEDGKKAHVAESTGHRC